MDKSSQKEALTMTETIMKLSLHYCKDSDDEIRAYSIRINNIAHDLNKVIERKLIDRIDS